MKKIRRMVDIGCCSECPYNVWRDEENSNYRQCRKLWPPKKIIGPKDWSKKYSHFPAFCPLPVATEDQVEEVRRGKG
jgi:hypothetical protein